MCKKLHLLVKELGVTYVKTYNNMEKRLRTKVGQKYWHLTVLEKFSKPTPQKKNAWYRCLCDCGKECEVHSDNLRRTNGTKSCGCTQYWGNRAVDLTGQKFGMLTAISPTEKRSRSSIIWLFQCDCGKQKEICCADVVKLSTKSCGCQFRNPDREDSVWKKMYSMLPTKSKRYGGDTDITYEDFIFLSKQNCFYCNSEPSNCAKSYGKDPIFVKYSGLDRIDSSLPYLLSNVRPCCYQCNGAKSNHTESGFFDFIKRVFETLKNKGLIND